MIVLNDERACFIDFHSGVTMVAAVFAACMSCSFAATLVCLTQSTYVRGSSLWPYAWRVAVVYLLAYFGLLTLVFALTHFATPTSRWQLVCY